VSPDHGSNSPEQLARKEIDARLEAAGWVVQDYAAMNVVGAPGVAVREFPLASGHGFADYLLFVDGQACGVVEAKPQGHTLTGVEVQAKKYATGLPDVLDAPVRPLPFLYLSTGAVTLLTNLLDPHPRSRHVFWFHRPETLREWLSADPISGWAGSWLSQVADHLPEKERYGARPSSLRGRMQALPPVSIPNLWQNKVEAITNLERSFFENRPRALIQMATGSGKTLLAITSIYRLIKYAGARRVLFLVDRKNLGEQATKEFSGYTTPDDQRKFTELYNVQLLSSNTIGPSSKVVVTTIQRLYSMLKGEEIDPELEEESVFELLGEDEAPVTVGYNATIPIEFFDVIFIDECHRSIYSLWRQVLEYFDAFLVGLTATPAKHTFGFFHKNLVMEYSHERAVADRVNVDFEIYQIRTKITTEGSEIKVEPATMIGKRDRATRVVRWERPDEDIEYAPEELDRKVVAKDQIRTIIQAFKEGLSTEIFPGRTEVPKTIIFAKNDSHAEDIVEIVREEFGRGNEFAQKITYKTTGQKPADLIQDFRNSFYPRIAVTVDMIATGTDIKPVEVVMFMRAVKSRTFFEQMKGRGVRVINDHDLRAVTPDAPSKTHFVIVDCVGISDTELADTQPLERNKGVSFKKLLEHVGAGGTNPEYLSSLASRLARLDKLCGPEERQQVEKLSGGVPVGDMVRDIIRGLDPDRQVAAAREKHALGDDVSPTDDQVGEAQKALLRSAVHPLAANPELRKALPKLKARLEQIIDEVSPDEIISAGFSDAAKERAKSMVQSFERFLDEHKDELDALQFFYSQPYHRRLRYKDIKALADTIKAPPYYWTPEGLWRAYRLLEQDKVKRASGQRLLSDIVSIVRFALHQEGELVPYQEQVERRFQGWMAQQAEAGRDFTEEQVRWLTMIKDHIATTLEITAEDFDYTPFEEEGGLGRAARVLGKDFQGLLRELNEVLVA